MSIQCVAVPKAHYDEFHRMFDAGQDVTVTDRWGQSSKLYRKDGKIYDTDRLNGSIDFDREVIVMPSDDVPRPTVEMRTQFAKLLGEYGPPKSTTRLANDTVMHIFEKDGRGWRYIVQQGVDQCIMLPL